VLDSEVAMETVLRGQRPGTHYPQCTSVQLYNAIFLLLHYSLFPVHHIILLPQGGERERLSYRQSEDKREKTNWNSVPTHLYSTCPDSVGCKMSHSWKQCHKLLSIIHELTQGTVGCWQGSDILIRKLQSHLARLIILL